MRAILPNYGWKICFLILSIQNFHPVLGGTACTDWLLGKAGVHPECPGNSRFELQIGNIPHGQEDLVSIFIVLSCNSNTTPRLCIVCLPIIRSYIGAWSPGLYSMMSS